MTPWIVGILSGIAGLVGMRMYDRVRLEKSRYAIGKLKAQNDRLTAKVASLEASLHEAKRAPMDHDDAARRLLDLANGDSPGRV